MYDRAHHLSYDASWPLAVALSAVLYRHPGVTQRTVRRTTPSVRVVNRTSIRSARCQGLASWTNDIFKDKRQAVIAIPPGWVGNEWCVEPPGGGGGYCTGVYGVCTVNDMDSWPVYLPVRHLHVTSWAPHSARASRPDACFHQFWWRAVVPGPLFSLRLFCVSTECWMCADLSTQVA